MNDQVHGMTSKEEQKVRAQAGHIREKLEELSGDLKRNPSSLLRDKTSPQ